MVTLILKPRKIVNGIPQWHDRVQVEALITKIISKSGSPGKNYLWLSLLGKIEEAAEGVQFNQIINDSKIPNLPPIPVELSNNQADLLWKELDRATDNPIEFYTGLIRCPTCGNTIGTNQILDAGILYLMLKDISDQLGTTFRNE